MNVETTPSVSSSTSLQYPNPQLVTYSPSVDSLLSPSLTPSSYNSPPPSHTFPVTYSLPSSAMSPLTESFFSDQIEFSFWFFSLGRTFLHFVSSHSAFILLSIQQNRYRPMCTFSFFISCHSAADTKSMTKTLVRVTFKCDVPRSSVEMSTLGQRLRVDISTSLHPI